MPAFTTAFATAFTAARATGVPAMPAGRIRMRHVQGVGVRVPAGVDGVVVPTRIVRKMQRIQVVVVPQ